MPAATWAWLRVVTSGFPLQGSEWEGWVFREGKFLSPEGKSFGVGEIRALPYTYARIAELERTAKTESNVIPLRPASPDLQALRRRCEYRGRLKAIVRAIASLEADLAEEFDDPALMAFAPQIRGLLEAACGHVAPLAKLTHEG